MAEKEKVENQESHGSEAQNGNQKTVSAFCAVEDHAAALNITAPVFAAVRQYKGWAAGKKIAKSEFEKAVKDFLNAPMGGV